MNEADLLKIEWEGMMDGDQRITSLVREIRERDVVIHDLQTNTDEYEVGYNVALTKARDSIQSHLELFSNPLIRSALTSLLNSIPEPTKLTLDHPDYVRAENDRLRRALEILATPDSLPDLYEAIAYATDALNGNTP